MWGKAEACLQYILYHLIQENGKNDHYYISYLTLFLLICFFCSAQVSQVYYWPNFEYEITGDKDDRVNHANVIFTESCVVAAVYVPTIDNQRKMQILNSNKRTTSDLDSIKITSLFDAQKKAAKHGTLKQSSLKLLNMEHLKNPKTQENYLENLTVAEECFKTLASCKDKEIIIEDEEDTEKNNAKRKSTEKDDAKYTHAIQLCDLLASRSGK